MKFYKKERNKQENKEFETVIEEYKFGNEIVKIKNRTPKNSKENEVKQ